MNPKFGPTRTLSSEMSEEEAKTGLENVVQMLEGFTECVLPINREIKGYEVV
jgi:hypothetical protein